MATRVMSTKHSLFDDVEQALHDSYNESLASAVNGRRSRSPSEPSTLCSALKTNGIVSTELSGEPRRSSSRLSQRDFRNFDRLTHSTPNPVSHRRGREQIRSFIDFEDDYPRPRDRGCRSAGEYGHDLANVFNDNNWDLVFNKCTFQNVSKDSRHKNFDDANGIGDILPFSQTNGGQLEEWGHFQSSDKIFADDEFYDEGRVEEKTNLQSSVSDFENEEEEDEEEASNQLSSEEAMSNEEGGELHGKLERMEQEQELLNNSLLALTSHFAQVQLRLRQIVEAKETTLEQREQMLHELENFANRGIPELMLFNAPPTLERSVSMATSLMADDVFEDDEQNEEVIPTPVDHCNRNSTSCEPRTSWSTSQADCDSPQHSKHHSTSTFMVTEEKLERQRNRQKELIGQLKDQLEDLEHYAYETGELNALPSSMLLERQNAIIEQLKSKLPVLSIDGIDKLSPEELRLKVDHAVRELVNPVIMKEQLVTQLKTQVTDLERFIEFLQKGGKHGKGKSTSGQSNAYLQFAKFLKLKRKTAKQANRNSKSSSMSSEPPSEHEELQVVTHQHQIRDMLPRSKLNDNIKNYQKAKPSNLPKTEKDKSNTTNTTTSEEEAVNIIWRLISLMQMFAHTQMGTCASFMKSEHVKKDPQFEHNSLKKSSNGRHWGDYRARLEISINEIVEFSRANHLPEGDHNTESEDFISLGNTALVINNYFAYEQITVMVRKDLASALRNLIHHGLLGCQQDAESDHAGTIATITEGGTLHALATLGFGCFNTRPAPLVKSKPKHAWEVILFYYNIKNGSKYRALPTRRLSQSFGLQGMSGNPVNPKHTLLVAIDEIIDSHTRFKRSYDAHFKAFICMGLNKGLLSQWLRLILRNPAVVSECYEKWSYTASTGFEDALRQLDKLATHRFCLPTDLAVRQLQSIHDAF